MKHNGKRKAWQHVLLSVALTFAWLPAGSDEAEAVQTAAARVDAATAAIAGRYLVIIGGCNDCHTDGWIQTGGTVPESEWLLGSRIGWQGPWGTTYPANLRLTVAEMDEEAWVAMLRTRRDNPPMPWMNLNLLSEDDARAIYAFIKSLGKSGERMPAYVPPGTEPETPYLVMEPQHMERLSPPVPETPAE
jgi:mono/diheme cytochrome c family protein